MVTTGVGKCRFTVVSLRNTQFILGLFLIIVLFSMQTTVNLRVPTPVLCVMNGDNVDSKKWEYWKGILGGSHSFNV